MKERILEWVGLFIDVFPYTLIALGVVLLVISIEMKIDRLEDKVNNINQQLTNLTIIQNEYRENPNSH